MFVLSFLLAASILVSTSCLFKREMTPYQKLTLFLTAFCAGMLSSGKVLLKQLAWLVHLNPIINLPFRFSLCNNVLNLRSAYLMSYWICLLASTLPFMLVKDENSAIPSVTGSLKNYYRKFFHFLIILIVVPGFYIQVITRIEMIIASTILVSISR